MKVNFVVMSGARLEHLQFQSEFLVVGRGLGVGLLFQHPCGRSNSDLAVVLNVARASLSDQLEVSLELRELRWLKK